MPPKKRHTAPTHSLSPLFFSFVLNIFSYSTFVFSAGFIHIYTHKKTKLVFLFFHWISTFAIITDNYKNIKNTKSCTYDLFPAKKGIVPNTAIYQHFRSIYYHFSRALFWNAHTLPKNPQYFPKNSMKMATVVFYALHPLTLQQPNQKKHITFFVPAKMKIV